MIENKIVIPMDENKFKEYITEQFSLVYTQEEYNNLTKEEKKDFINECIKMIKFKHEIKMIIKELDYAVYKYLTEEQRKKLITFEEE